MKYAFLWVFKIFNNAETLECLSVVIITKFVFLQVLLTHQRLCRVSSPHLILFNIHPAAYFEENPTQF